MTGSACISSAETAAGDTGALTEGGKKPRENKTIAIKGNAYTVLTEFASEKGSDRKSVASEAITAYCTGAGVNADLPQLIARTNHVTVLLLGQLEKACEGETVEIDVVRALGPLTVGLVHEIPRLTALPEKSSSGKSADPERVKGRCLTREELKEELNRPYAAPPGDRAEK